MVRVCDVRPVLTSMHLIIPTGWVIGVHSDWAVVWCVMLVCLVKEDRSNDVIEIFMCLFACSSSVTIMSVDSESRFNVPSPFGSTPKNVDIFRFPRESLGCRLHDTEFDGLLFERT